MALRKAIQHLFEIDVRSLALFRIAIGILLLTDLAIRATDLHAMYSDDGMFPRAEICRRFTSIWNWSFHFASGSEGYAACLFLIAGVLALAMLVGFETRIATVGSWLMLLSIHHRVPALLSGAEVLLRMLLFWGMFLPLGSAWSLDSWRVRRAIPTDGRWSVLSVASAAILLQMALMYLFSSVAKWNEQWLHGEALGGILAHGFFASPPATFFSQFPTFLRGMTWATLVLEWAAPALLFFRRPWWRLRMAIIACLAIMHLGIAMCLEVGFFSYVSLAGLCLFLPREFWENRWLRKWSAGATGTVSRIEPGAPGFSITPLAWVGRGLGIFLLTYVLAVNFNSFPSHPLDGLGLENWMALSRGIGISQKWGMFGAIPTNDGWYVAKARLADGSEVDLLRHGAAVDWKRPPYPARLFPNCYWQKLFREMTYFDEQGYQIYRGPVAEYLCREWNKRNKPQKQVSEFEFVFCMQDKATAASTASPTILLRQLVRLDFSLERDRPAISGYTDADQSALPPGGR